RLPYRGASGGIARKLCRGSPGALRRATAGGRYAAMQLFGKSGVLDRRASRHGTATTGGVDAAMKLVVFGLSASSSWGNGHAVLWRALIRALAANGHVVVFFERDVPYYAQHRDQTEIEGGRLVLYDEWNAVRPLAERELADADAGMVTSYCPDGIGATELVLEAPGLHVFYDLDTPVTLARLAAGEPLEAI